MKKSKKCALNEAAKREKISSALLRKRECERKALDIVERLTEETATSSWLVEAAASINQGYYDDIVTERSILKICGYATCSNRITRVTPAKFHISLRDKKVYDTEERKKFCCGICFKASNFLRAQLDSSPLWLRETVSSRVTLYEENPEAVSGLPAKGEVVELLGSVRLPPEGDLDQHVVIVENNEEGLTIKEYEDEPPKPKLKSSILKKPGRPPIDNKEVVLNQAYTGLQQTVIEKRLKNLTICDENIGPEKISEPETFETFEPPSVLVERTVSEWFTKKTLSLLAEPVSDEEEEDDPEDVVGSFTDNQSSKFLLDPEMAREAEMHKSKFAAFLQGQETYQENIHVKEKDVNDDSPEPRLPLLDRHAQSQLRVRIVLEQLGRHATDILLLFSLPVRLVQDELRVIVRTLELSPSNITLKPVEWRLMSIVLLHIVSKRNEEVGSVLESEAGRNSLQVLLEQFQVPPAFVAQLLKKAEKKLCS